jgi:FkbM family methyltransferase
VYAMKAMIKGVIRKVTPRQVANVLHESLLREGRVSHSQEGEDLIVDRFFGEKNTGFYVDVGAHHPWRFSNTYLFYQRGWRGINIDPRPGIMADFARERPGDINVEAAIGEKEEARTFYIFNEPALSTFSEEEAKKKDGLNGFYRIIDKRTVKVRRLDSILDEYMPADVTIDFLSIDVEGLDLEVVRSNNWQKYLPKLIIMEQLESSLESILAGDTHRFFKAAGYELFAKCVNSVIYTKT